MVRFQPRSLRRPVVGAPMAGGPSTPELAAAVSNAGGLGCLAAGYRTPELLRQEIRRTRALTSAAFGVNLFVPRHANTVSSGTPGDLLENALAFRDRLVRDTGLELPLPDPLDDDGWAAKLEIVAAERVPVVSLTFGLPAPSVISTLVDAGSLVAVTVTGPAEARAAADAGAGMLCVQGPEAGGHRGTWDSTAPPPGAGLPDLLRQVRTVCPELFLVAAGGIASQSDAAGLRRAGADAVQVGTLLLLSPEAGTGAVHRAALTDEGFPGTSLTRAFSGRWARGLTNAFMRDYADAPAAYPYTHQVTAPLRAAARDAGDPQRASLWAGTGFRAARPRPAADTVRWLAGG